MKKKQTDLLRLNLQFFSEEPPADPSEPPAPTFTQADIERIVGERLAREKAKAEKAVEEAKAEAERKRLEEESEFKTLYEAEKAAREKVEAERHAERLQVAKVEALRKAGFSEDVLADAVEFITGDDEESVRASVEKFAKVSPPKPTPVDPSLGGGGRVPPKPKDDGYEAAREKARKLLKR